MLSIGYINRYLVTMQWSSNVIAVLLYNTLLWVLICVGEASCGMLLAYSVTYRPALKCWTRGWPQLLTRVSELRNFCLELVVCRHRYFSRFLSHSREISGQKYSVGHARQQFAVPLSYEATHVAFDRNMKIQVFWDVTLCPCVNNFRRVEGS